MEKKLKKYMFCLLTPKPQILIYLPSMHCLFGPIVLLLLLPFIVFGNQGEEGM